MSRFMLHLRSGVIHVILATGLLVSLAIFAAGGKDISDSRVSPIQYANRPPTLFSTYLGGSELDMATAVAIDLEGFVYVAGYTVSDDFPTKGPAQNRRGGFPVGSDAFVVKYDPDTGEVVYATYLGGSMGEELTAGLTVDTEGRAIVVGTTTSADFPNRNALQSFRGGDRLFTDAFVARLSSDGSEIEFSSVIGGTGDESAFALALDADGNVFITGSTTSTDFPSTTGVFQTVRAGTEEAYNSDAFLLRLTPDGAGYQLDYATYLGGSRHEIPMALDVAAGGAVWVAGSSTSTDFPTVDALQDTYAGPVRELQGDVFLSRIGPGATILEFSTYLGGAQSDQPTGLAIDTDGAVYVTGSTSSPDFPASPGAFQMDRHGQTDRFLTKVISDGGGWHIDVSTRFGSTGRTFGVGGLVVDQAERVWIAGATESDALPLMDPGQFIYGGGASDGFLARIDASGTVLGYSSFLGGSNADVVTAIALRGSTLCVTGGTGSSDFDVLSAAQTLFDGPITSGDAVSSAFVTCFITVNEASQLSSLAVSPDSVALIAGQTARFSADGYDQFGQAYPIEPVWSATGGTIDPSGLFTAGDDAGVFSVAVSDAATSVSSIAVVNVYSGLAGEKEPSVPTEFAVYSNYPNPFNPQTTIRFDVREPARVMLRVYDLLGRMKLTLVDRDYAPGRHEAIIDGDGWASGTYFYEIRMGENFREVRKMVLVR